MFLKFIHLLLLVLMFKNGSSLGDYSSELSSFEAGDTYGMKKSRSAYGPWTFMRKRSPVLEFPTPYTKRLEMTSNSEGPSLIRFARSGDSPFIRFGKRLSNSPVILENNEKMNNRKIRTPTANDAPLIRFGKRSFYDAMLIQQTEQEKRQDNSAPLIRFGKR